MHPIFGSMICNLTYNLMIDNNVTILETTGLPHQILLAEHTLRVWQ
jgi:hypothetical protein